MSSQRMSSPEIQSFISNWNRIHKQTAIVLAAVPDAKLGYQPQEDMFSLRQLVTHIVRAEVGLTRSALAGSTQKIDLDLSESSVEQLVEAFNKHHAELVEEVSQLAPEQLKEEVEFAGHRLSRKALLNVMTEHEISHRGQLFVYLRLVGVQPPNIYGV